MISLKEQLGSQQEQINSKRIGNFVKLLKAESKQLIETGENGKGDFRKHPTSTTDLSSKLSSINVENLMSEINREAAEMWECAIIIERRVAIHNALFPDDKVEPLSADELDFLNGLFMTKKE